MSEKNGKREENLKTLGELLRTKRIAAGLSRYKLALKIPTFSVNITNWEEGKYKPNDETLAVLFSITVLQLTQDEVDAALATPLAEPT